jgi:hypothetical protein
MAADPLSIKGQIGSPLRYVLDEHLRRRLWQAVQRHNGLGVDPMDIVRVGDPPDLPLSSSDPEILLWAERENRILISRDKKTLPGYLADHLSLGRGCPGIFIVKRGSKVRSLVEFLAYAAYESGPHEWRDRIEHIS